MLRKLLLAATVLAPIAAPGVSVAQPVTGIYIAGAGGANFLQREKPGPNSYFGFRPGYVGLGSVGYGFGNGVRVELEGNYRNNQFGTGSGGSGHEEKFGGLANVLFDLDIGSPYVFPYIGAGAGYAQVQQRRALNFSTPGFYDTDTIHGSNGSFAVQGIAGFSFPIPPVVGLSLTAEYRFYALTGTRTFTDSTNFNGSTSSARFKEKEDYNHSLLLGLRYAFNVVPPPPPEAPAAPPAPQAEASRTYLVFFDWDRADLTDRARQIIAQAAQATTRVQVTRIEVSGHTDTTGTARYNQGLSVRRAQTVAAELVRLGIPQASITTQGFGFSRPLVATGPGVREPQNRRVEIVLR